MTMDELKKLSQEERAEIGQLCIAALGETAKGATA